MIVRLTTTVLVVVLSTFLHFLPSSQGNFLRGIDNKTVRDHSYITSALVGGMGGQKMPIFAYS